MRSIRNVFVLVLVMLLFLQSITCCGFAAEYIISESVEAVVENSNTFFNNEEFEFYSNSDDEDKLYKVDLNNGTETKVLDEHVITLAAVDDCLLMSVYRDGTSKLLKFSMNDHSCTEIFDFKAVVNNFSLRNELLFYAVEDGIYSFNISSGEILNVISAQNIDLIYFSDCNTLKYYVKQEDGNYVTNELLFGNASKTMLKADLNEENHELVTANSSYTPRLTAPSKTDPYYTTNNPFHNKGYGMVQNNGNCTCYAYGRSYENLRKKPNLCLKDAGEWYDYNVKNKYYEYGSKPYLGSVVVWSKPQSSGHVAVVEVIDGDTVITSESGWKSFYFKTVTRDAASKNLSASAGYTLLGYIYVVGKLTNVPPPSPVLTEYKDFYFDNETVKLSWKASKDADWYKIDITNGKGEKVVSKSLGTALTFSQKLPSDTYTACVSTGNLSGTTQTTLNFKIVKNLGSAFYANITGSDGNLYLTDNTSNVIMNSKDDSLAQIWKFKYLGDGSYEITSAYTSETLQSEDDSRSEKTNVITSFPHNEQYQQWYVFENNSTYWLRNKATDMAISVTKGNMTSGANVLLNKPDYTATQAFKINILSGFSLNIPSAPSVTLDKKEYKLGDKVKASWKSVAGAKSYCVYVLDWNGNVCFSSDLETKTSTTVTLPSGKYSAYVAAVNDNGQSYGWADFSVKANQIRISGLSRYDTAIEISNKGWKSSETVILANSMSYADALAGVPLAYKLNAPILLTAGNDTLEKSVMEQIEKLGPKKIILLGGSGVISNKIRSTLQRDYEVERISGFDRYLTAIAISYVVAENPETAFVVTGTGYADALSISPYAALKGYPIVYSNPNTGLTEETLNYLEPVENIIIIGGEGVVRQNTVDQLKGKNIKRIFGQDRYLTSHQIAATFADKFENDVMLATGVAFPDALAGGVLAAKLKTPLLLAHPNGAIDEIKNFIHEKKPENIYILGGEGAMPTSVIDKIYG